VRDYDNLQSYLLNPKLRLHYNYNNTNNELTHEMSSVYVLIRQVRSYSLNMDLRHKYLNIRQWNTV
jgi:hypothetical protein